MKRILDTWAISVLKYPGMSNQDTTKPHSDSGLFNSLVGPNENSWCGPSALKAITGITTPVIEKWAQARRRNETPKRPSQISSMWIDELLAFLDYAGHDATYEAVAHQNPGAYAVHQNEWGDEHIELLNTRPTLARWIKQLEPDPNKKYIVRVGGQKMGHFIAISKPSKSAWVVDTLERHPRPIPAGWRYNRHRVSHVITITD